MVTHDLDSLHAVCDRIAVLLDKRVVVGTMEEMLAYDHPWVREYFHGPRGRAALKQELIRAPMEKSSPYVLIGAAVMLFVAAVVGFVIWKLRAGDQTSYAYYVILFSGDVQGLTPDSPVYYRGLRVGRVHDIALTSRVDVQRSTGRERLSEKIQVTVAVDSHIDIRERSYAVFEKPFIAGAAFVQIVGRVDVDQIKPKKRLGEKPYPEIREGASFLQVTSTSAQELLSKAGTTVDRLNELLNPDNIQSVSDSLRSLNTTLAGIAKQDANIQKTLADLPDAVADFKQDLRQAELGGRPAQPDRHGAGAAGRRDARRRWPARIRASCNKTLARGAQGADQHRRRVGPAQQAGRRQQGRASANSPRTAWSSCRYAIRELRQLTAEPQHHRHQDRARPGELRVQRQAGIHAQMNSAWPSGRLRGRPAARRLPADQRGRGTDRPLHDHAQEHVRARHAGGVLAARGRGAGRRRPTSTPAASPSPSRRPRRTTTPRPAGPTARR